LIDDKQYCIKFVEEAETVFARDVCFEEEASDSVSECLKHFEELHNEEPCVEALVDDLKEAWEHFIDKQTTAPSTAHSAAQNSHVLASFNIQQQQVSSPIDPVQPKDLEGQPSGPRASSNSYAMGQ